jgi:hypothetical protein
LSVRWRLASEIRFALKAEQGRRRRGTNSGETAEAIATFPADRDSSEDVSKRQQTLPVLRSRWELTKIIRPRGVGVELGVANGIFSELILSKSTLDYLYSIDMYGDRKHPVAQYKSALVRLAPYRARNSILRMRFDEASSLFPDQYFDFIYVDGFAANGEEGGTTFYDWWPKLKRGGVFAGHDYSPDWPLVVKAVDRFIAETGLCLFTVGGEADPDDAQNRYASWFTVRT